MTAFYISELSRLYLVILIFAAVVGKAASFADFRESVAALTGLPAALAHYGAVAVIGSEAATALLLAAGGERSRVGVAASLALFAAFGLVLAVALVQRKSISCNCFGSKRHVISSLDLARNAFLIGVCVLYLLFAPADGTSGIGAYVLLGGAALLLFLATTNLNVIARWVR